MGKEKKNLKSKPLWGSMHKSPKSFTGRKRTCHFESYKAHPTGRNGMRVLGVFYGKNRIAIGVFGIEEYDTSLSSLQATCADGGKEEI